MKFWIITPTYNRHEFLKRNIISLQKQGYKNYEHIIIDDSSDDITYKNTKDFCHDTRIKYHKNVWNKWVNYCRNKWIELLGQDVDYVLFLDDDDYLNTDTLENAYKVIWNNTYSWYVSNKKWISHISEYKKEYNYFLDYFLWTHVSWDTTHIIKKEKIENIRFSLYIKQAEEWLFFIELGVSNTFYAYDYDSTISHYLENGLSEQDKNNRYKVYIRHICALCEFIFIRKIPISFKVFFLKTLFQKIILWKKTYSSL